MAWFQDVLKDAIGDFQAHLDEGLIEEEVVVIEEPDETLFTVATEAGGLRADTINNFVWLRDNSSIREACQASPTSEPCSLGGINIIHNEYAGQEQNACCVDYAPGCIEVDSLTDCEAIDGWNDFYPGEACPSECQLPAIP